MDTVILMGNYIEVSIPKFVLELVPSQGDATEDLNGVVELSEVKEAIKDINKTKLVEELRGYGAWTDEELENHKDNIIRFLWISILDYKEENL